MYSSVIDIHTPYIPIPSLYSCHTHSDIVCIHMYREAHTCITHVEQTNIHVYHDKHHVYNHDLHHTHVEYDICSTAYPSIPITHVEGTC
jgi:hypothetical protein